MVFEQETNVEKTDVTEPDCSGSLYFMTSVEKLHACLAVVAIQKHSHCLCSTEHFLNCGRDENQKTCNF